MAVQIYQNEELNDIMFQVEALEEWKSIAGELGMDSQLGFISKAESPIPYPFINESMQRVFKTLCPTSVDFRKYDKTPIPLEVLKQISYSVKENHFKEIQVWYDDKSPDPFVIGIDKRYYAYDRKYNSMKGADNVDMLFDTAEQCKDYAATIGFDCYGTNPAFTNQYLIARWGDEIRPISELKELAKDRLIEKYGSELKNEIENKTQSLKKLTENTLLYLSAEISESQLKGDSRF